MYAFPNLEPICRFMSGCNLTCIQISQEASKVVWYSHLLKNFSQFVMIDTVKGFSVFNKAEVDVFPELLLFWWSNRCWQFDLWKFSVHVLLKPHLENFEHYFASMWDEYNFAVVWTFFGIAFLWDWNENWPFAVLWLLLSFPNLLEYWVQHLHSIIF